MTIGGNSLTARLLVLVAVTILHRVSLNSVSASCEFSIVDHKKLYNYSLASPSSKFPHGVLSEDGFYKVAGNGTVLWFQLCDGMIFNHDRPTCLDCTTSAAGLPCIWIHSRLTILSQLLGLRSSRITPQFGHEIDAKGMTIGGNSLTARLLVLVADCGGPSRCGMGCSALVANSIGDTRRPHMGVVVVMSNRSPVYNCSISVSVLCDLDGVQGPQTLEKVGICGYATQLRHPSGCARIVSAHGNGWGWFGGIMT
ncbi:hypothetical protein RJ639_009490, partial [Escallonia herrerae]